MPSILTRALLCLLFVAAVGCGGAEQPDANRSAADAPAKSPATPTADVETPRKTPADATPSRAARRRPIFGDNSPTTGSKSPVSGGTKLAGGLEHSAKEQLKKLQVIVGGWKGLPQLRNKPTLKLEEPKAEWKWDFSKPDKPALVYVTDSKHYHKQARLTYDRKTGRLTLVATDSSGKRKTYSGDFPRQIRDFSEDGKTIERSFQLKFTQVDPPPKPREDHYQIEVQQLRNDRQLFIVSDRRGSSIRPAYRMANQRLGTSFAAKLDDYGEKTCVVSQGLGTTAVSHNGKTYYVCCSGCKQAFEAEPERWIASFAKWQRERGKK